MKFKNTYTKMERFTNSFSSRKRIEILLILENNKNLTLNKISEILHTNKQNTSLHTFKLLNQGLIAKRQNGIEVEHILTGRGKMVLKFLLSIDKNL